MSSHVLPAWAAHAAGWTSRHPEAREAQDRQRQSSEALMDRTGIVPSSIRKIEGLGVLITVLAVSAAASALPALSPNTPLAAQTLAAERSLAAARASSSGPEVAPVWQPRLDLMLPVLPAQPAEPCAPPGC